MTTPTTQREADERTQQVLDLDRLEVEVRSYEKFGYVRARIPIADALTLIAKARAAIDQSEALALDLSGLPLYFKEGVENGGYYLATDVIRLVTLARQVAPEAPAAATDQPSTGEMDEASDCTEPNRKACPRLCIDFCNAAEQARASLTPTAPQAASQQADEAADAFCDANCTWTDHHPECKFAAPQAATTASAFDRHMASSIDFDDQKTRVLLSELGIIIGCKDGRTGREKAEAVLRWIAKERFLAAPAEAFAWATLADNGNVIIWSKRRSEVEPVAAKYGRPVTPIIALEVAAPVKAAQPALPAIEYDYDMDRTYIPLPGGWEIQTKGKGSSFRIAHVQSCHRWIVMDERLHEVLEALARSVRNAFNATTPGAAQTTDAREGWLPIETAPKDGTEVLLYLKEPYSEVRLARWFEPWLNWIEGEFPDPERDEHCGIGSACPSHWMPLPSKPTDKGQTNE